MGASVFQRVHQATFMWGSLVGLCICPAVAGTSPDPVVVLPGLEDAASLWWDRNGVAHVDAEALVDGVAVQGYAAASERMYHLDHLRHAAGGRTAELYGPDQLEVDPVLRRLQLRRAATELLAGASPDTRALFEAYARGVNTYLRRLRAGLEALPPEYGELGLGAQQIPDWEPVDSGLCAMIYGFSLASPFVPEAIHGLTRQLLGPRLVSDLLRFAPVEPTPIIEPAERPPLSVASEECPGPQADAAKVAMDEALDETELGWVMDLFADWRRASRVAGILPNPYATASNNWVVAPALTRNGHALLANDPHLSAQAYNQTFLLRLVSPELRWTGAGLGGVPGVGFGHNDHHALGFTALAPDNLDLYLESVPVPGHVVHRGTLVPMQRTRETYVVNEGGVLVDRTDQVRDGDTFYVPHHGPVLAFGPLGRSAITCKWTGYRPGAEADHFIAALLAPSLEEYLVEARAREVLPFNAVYADVEGNIHYSGSLRYPRRRFPRLAPPWWILPGGGLFDWNGALPEELQPDLLNPARGWIATANNDPWGLTFDNDPLSEGTYHGVVYDIGFRATRIGALVDSLASERGVTLGDMARIQRDTAWSLAGRYLTHLDQARRARPDLVSANVGEALDRLAQWNLSTHVDRAEPSIFFAWLSHFSGMVLSDDVGPLKVLLSWPEVVTPGLLFVLDDGVANRTGDRIFDDLRTPLRRETREEAILGAMDRAVATLAERFGTSEQSRWRWGTLHRVRFGHPLGGEFDLDNDGAGFEADGASSTVDVAGTGLDPDDASIGHLPVLRFIVELDPAGIKSWWMLSTGNGGVGGEHYGDLTERYLQHRYFQILDDPAQRRGPRVRLVGAGPGGTAPWGPGPGVREK